jgi:hypothetical protein
MTEKEVVFGVYFHPKKGLAVASPADDKKNNWKIDKNKKVQHPIFNVKVGLVETGTGSYFFYKSLKGYEYIGEE